MLGFSKANRMPGPRSGVSSVSSVVHLRMSGFFAVDFGLRVAEMRVGTVGSAITAWRRDVAHREEGTRRRERRGAGEGGEGKGTGEEGRGRWLFQAEETGDFPWNPRENKGSLFVDATQSALIRPHSPSAPLSQSPPSPLKDALLCLLF